MTCSPQLSTEDLGESLGVGVAFANLFHELKQQFPTVPDHIVTACISEFANRNIPEGDSESESSIREVLEAAKALRSATEDNQELMGRKTNETNRSYDLPSGTESQLP
ncbi:hypothetical protein FQA39_LY10214 [Lamprigera yunnana]|nr:hypothetical protein FQA39_LY10214 [Lamprigera yunnana]